jgi:hypothetical protein
MALIPIALPKRWRQRPVAQPRRGPQSRMAEPLRYGHRGLRFTELLFLAVLSLAYLLSVSSPVFGIQMHHTGLNHFPFMLMLPVLTLHAVGLVINRPDTPWNSLLKAALPLVLLAVFALVGSAVAKWELDITETYLAFGAYLLLLPVYASLTADGERLWTWALALITVWVLFSVAALVGQAARFGGLNSLHEIEYLVTAGFLTLYYATRSRVMQWLAVLLLLAAAVLNQKLTGYIVAALAVLHILVASGWRQLPIHWRGFYGLGAGVFVAVVSAVLTLLYFEFREYLPSGNVEVRLTQYEQAMRQFLDSPVWGSAYLDGSGEVFLQANRALNIPTHSDVLDLLKHGGLIAFGLFAWGYWKIFSLVNRAVVLTTGQRLINAYFVGARFFIVTALLTFSLNPLLLKGPFLIVIWSNLGLALGLALAAQGAAARQPA